MIAPAPAASNRTSTTRKCAQCGLVNFATNDACRRCGNALTGDSAPAAGASRGVRRRLLWLAAVTISLIFLWSRSLLLTSEPIDPTQQPVVLQAVRLLEQRGFSREALVLRHFANFRATDNWWNRYLGHREAYAATNFPLGVVTLYPPFFTVAVDDVERAAILLHEAQHLLGAGEESALERVWRDKGRFGWAADAYGRTKVWKNTREWTIAAVPTLFQCGANAAADCVP